MNFDLDLELRLAVFAHVQRLRDATGVVNADELDRGLVFHGERVPIWNRQKGIFRPRVLRGSGAALSIQTAYDGPYDDHWAPDDDRLAYRYRGTDPEHADNRALRRAMEIRRPVLYLIAVRPGIYEPVLPCYVVGDDPTHLTFFLVADAEGRVQSALDAPSDWPLKAYITRAVKQRLHQQRFRYLVLNAYREQCAMCRLRHPPLLEAAHILPDRDVRGQPEIPNGLALCRIHHGAYDVGILGVDPEYCIHLRADVLEEHDGPMLRHGLQEMHGARIELPRKVIDRPNAEYLAERYDRFRAA
ncbi:MAG: HNH endonuclease [Longimicrobiales bacterium]